MDTRDAEYFFTDGKVYFDLRWVHSSCVFGFLAINTIVA